MDYTLSGLLSELRHAIQEEEKYSSRIGSLVQGYHTWRFQKQTDPQKSEDPENKAFELISIYLPRS